ncbi:MAG: hypothetical protein EOP51_10655 [Sphingobacteriales bacterium]|nr:MAG: hypothetical protein EOP51_10655 [Sphingobacteriales bacterium]
MRILAITLMLCFCYQLVARLGVWAWYEANKQYVATVLCENKDKPAMKCCGKCYLRKQINNTGDNTESTPGKQQVKWEKLSWIAVLPIAKTSEISLPVVADKKAESYYRNLYKFTSVTSIFHPPGVC